MFASKESIKYLTYSAIALAIAFVLSMIKLFALPQGGSVTACSMLFVCLIGYWFGTKKGIVAGVAYGLLQLIINPIVLYPVQFLLDYPLGFGMLGLAGLFRERKYGLYYGYCLAALMRFVCSFLSGWFFFAEYTPEGMMPVVYSAWYNISYIAPEMVITLILLCIPSFKKAIDSIRA